MSLVSNPHDLSIKNDSSGSPLGRLSLLMALIDHSPSISRPDLLAERVLVLLSGALHQGHEGDESEKEEELVLVPPDGVHAVQGQGPGEALIAHVEGAQEGEVCHSIDTE